MRSAFGGGACSCISETLPRGGEQVLTLARWSPTSELTNLHTAMDRLFSDLFGEPMRSPLTAEMGRAGAPTYHLPVDIAEVDNGYRIQAPVPGFKPEDVEVTFSDGVLTINAKRSEEKSRECPAGRGIFGAVQPAQRSAERRLAADALRRRWMMT